MTGGTTLKIVMLTGSPHKDGASALLADKFSEGACANNHNVVRFDTAFLRVGGCLACGYCRKQDGGCVQKDAMEDILPPLLDAHLVVFVTPLYYFGISSQLKAVIDRFYAVDKTLSKQPKEAILMATAHNKNEWAVEGLTANYNAILKHLHWQDRGILLAQGIGTRADIEASDFPEKAKALGLSLA